MVVQTLSTNYLSCKAQVHAFIQYNPNSMQQHAQELKVSVLKEKS